MYRLVFWQNMRCIYSTTFLLTLRHESSQINTTNAPQDTTKDEEIVQLKTRSSGGSVEGVRKGTEILKVRFGSLKNYW